MAIFVAKNDSSVSCINAYYQNLTRMTGVNSLDSIKRKIQTLQQQADDAEDRAQLLQRELDNERDQRENVRAAYFSSLP